MRYAYLHTLEKKFKALDSPLPLLFRIYALYYKQEYSQAHSQNTTVTKPVGSELQVLVYNAFIVIVTVTTVYCVSQRYIE